MLLRKNSTKGSKAAASTSKSLEKARQPVRAGLSRRRSSVIGARENDTHD
jgi:hypothetical protein